MMTINKIDTIPIKDKLIMRKLIDKLAEETYWYEKGMPRISDAEWDHLYFTLHELELHYECAYPDSPTQTITNPIVSKLEKVKHNHPMLSLQKTKDIDEVNKFTKNNAVLAMCKMDGLTLSLRYNKGRLISAETRGNGVEGEDVLHNVLQISSIPKQIYFRDELIVDGEIICKYDDFEQFKKDYKNPRNFAAGSIRLLDSKECESRHLTFLAWDVIEGFTSSTVSFKLKELTKYGFTVCPYLLLTDGYISEKDILDLKEQAENLSYPIDGIVFKFNDVKYGASLGRTAHHFNNAIAYKFFDEVFTTKILDIEWTMGRTGVLTPVAILEPIDIDGTEVSRASMHNVSIMEGTLGRPYYGQEVEVFKANMIIPQIRKGVKSNLKDVKYIPIPYTCPFCGSLLAKKEQDGVKTLACISGQCETQFVNKLDHFCSKKGLDIKGLSKLTLEKLINWGYISSYEDVFKLEKHKKYWSQQSGFGVKSVEKILKAIEESKITTFDKVISAAGIPLIGTTVAKDLAKKFENYDSFRQAIDKGFDFSSFDGYGPEMNKALLSFDYTELDNIVKNHLTITYFKEEEKEQPLEGRIFVITGKLKNYKNRDELKKIIEAFGGKVAGSVTKKTSYLINNDNTSTTAKNISAQTLGVPILTEEEFIKLFDL